MWIWGSNFETPEGFVGVMVQDRDTFPSTIGITKIWEFHILHERVVAHFNVQLSMMPTYLCTHCGEPRKCWVDTRVCVFACSICILWCVWCVSVSVSRGVLTKVNISYPEDLIIIIYCLVPRRAVTVLDIIKWESHKGFASLNLLMKRSALFPTTTHRCSNCHDHDHGTWHSWPASVPYALLETSVFVCVCSCVCFLYVCFSCLSNPRHI